MISNAASRPNAIVERHLQSTAAFYDAHPSRQSWAGRQYKAALAHYYRLMIPPDASVLEVGCAAGALLALLPNRRVMGIDVSEEQIQLARAAAPWARFEVAAGETFASLEKFDYIILSDVINVAADVQQMLENLRSVSHPRTRLIINYFNNVWRPAVAVATWTGQRSSHPAASWFSPFDVCGLLRLSGWNPIIEQPRILVPFSLGGLGRLINRVIAPLAPWFCLSTFCVARPLDLAPPDEYSVSVIVPARNEAGNIEAAVQRTPELGRGTEIIFIEGHSRDETWNEIERVARTYTHRNIRAMRQTGSGKANATHEAFAAARGDILMILDGDLTTAPEDLPKFYNALARGRAEFANGVRLVYPIEERAMRFFNLIANKVFSILFSWTLGQPVKDTLCGTKVLFRADYERLVKNRSYFGNFDPFGDFDLLFGAGKLNMQIVDIPIRYRDRTYGSTNIHRWRHGSLLVRMTIFGASKLKFV